MGIDRGWNSWSRKWCEIEKSFCMLDYSWIGADNYLRFLVYCTILCWLSSSTATWALRINLKWWMNKYLLLLRSRRFEFVATVLPPRCHARPLVLHRNSLTKTSMYSECFFLPRERLECLILESKGHLQFAHYFAVPRIWCSSGVFLNPDVAMMSPPIVLDLPL